MVPGDERPAFTHGSEVRQVLNDAEQELQSWQPNLEPIQKASAVGANAMPEEAHGKVASPTSVKSSDLEDTTTLHDAGTVAAEPASEKTKEPLPA